MGTATPRVIEQKTRTGLCNQLAGLIPRTRMYHLALIHPNVLLATILASIRFGIAKGAARRMPRLTLPRKTVGFVATSIQRVRIGMYVTTHASKTNDRPGIRPGVALFSSEIGCSANNVVA